MHPARAPTGAICHQVYAEFLILGGNMLNPHKHLSTQVIVICGATSLVGVTTARMAAKQGAKLVLASSNQAALDHLSADILRHGGELLALRVDPSDKDQVAALGRAAVQRFGVIDTWVNLAADGHVPSSQDGGERQFKTDFWATVHGTIVARGLMSLHGGAIVNFDSDASAKHDVRRFTEALRAEIDTDGVPISVTLLHALDAGAKNTAQLVAEAILYAAVNEQHDIHVGRIPRVTVRQPGAAVKLLARCMDILMLRHPQNTWHF
jgi:short-subunit dehydrogenase